MKRFGLPALSAIILGLALPALAQNVAIVNGKGQPLAAAGRRLHGGAACRGPAALTILSP